MKHGSKILMGWLLSVGVHHHAAAAELSETTTLSNETVNNLDFDLSLTGALEQQMAKDVESEKNLVAQAVENANKTAIHSTQQAVYAQLKANQSQIKISTGETVAPISAIEKQAVDNVLVESTADIVAEDEVLSDVSIDDGVDKLLAANRSQPIRNTQQMVQERFRNQSITIPINGSAISDSEPKTNTNKKTTKTTAQNVAAPVVENLAIEQTPVALEPADVEQNIITAVDNEIKKVPTVRSTQHRVANSATKRIPINSTISPVAKQYTDNSDLVNVDLVRELPVQVTDQEIAEQAAGAEKKTFFSSLSRWFGRKNVDDTETERTAALADQLQPLTGEQDSYSLANEQELASLKDSVSAPANADLSGGTSANKKRISLLGGIDKDASEARAKADELRANLSGGAVPTESKIPLIGSKPKISIPTTAEVEQSLSKSYRSVANHFKELVNPKERVSTRGEVASLSSFNFEPEFETPELPRLTALSALKPSELKPIEIVSAVKQAVSRHPDISRALSELANSDANIDIAKAGYYPQISGGASTGRLGSSSFDQPILSLDATQLVYDFGKVKSSVNEAEATVRKSQAEVLLQIDEIALEAASAVVNVRRYQELVNIAQRNLAGIKQILDIAVLRAQAGVSSQADPTQALTRFEGAQANLVVQQSNLREWQQRLSTLLGVSAVGPVQNISDQILERAQLFVNPDFKTIPEMIIADADREIAVFQKEAVKASRFPTLSLNGSMSKSLNGGINPDNFERDSFYSSLSLAASSNLYQGGATSARTRAAGFAEEAAKANINAVYLEVKEDMQTARERIENLQKQMNVLKDREDSIILTRELYQEQYKLGKRTVVDLLNAEQEIHSAASERENARYDIWDNVVNYISVTGRIRTAYGLDNTTVQGFEIKP